MIKFILGGKGSGKTKTMIGMANEAVKATKGDVVYIDRDKNHIYDLDKSLRFIETGDFQFDNLKTFYGFLCGVIAQDFDVEKVFVDGQKLIAVAEEKCMEDFITNLKKLVDKFGVSFVISCSRTEQEVPEIVKQYL